MIRNFLRIILLIGFLPILAGCKYDGSFMQMDSNSGVPFFGLQLAVDSGSRPPTSRDSNESGGNSTYNLKFQDARDSTRESRLDADTWPENSALLRVGN